MLSDCLLISNDVRDREFATKMSDDVPFMLTIVNNSAALTDALALGGKPFLFINLDDPTLVRSMEGTIRNRFGPQQVLGISDRPVDESLLNPLASMCGHFLVRRYPPVAATIVGKLLEAYDGRDVFGITRFGPLDAAHQRIMLPTSGARRLAAEAMTKVLSGRGIPARLVALAAQALDEFLMNAIFDAPVDNNQTRFRRETPRSSDFPLDGKNEVYVDFLAWNEAVAISVTDRYGSLKIDSLMSYLRKDYEKQDFQPRQGSESAGVGAYGMLNSGLSLVFLTQAKHRTEAVLFIPIVKNYREFRASFQFLSCFALE